FFFQAEDGIRDATVTGVQTCALPIFISKPPFQRCAGPETNGAGDDADDDAVPGQHEPGRRSDGAEASNGPGDHAEHRWFAPRPQIGRASCREREESSGVWESVKDKIV